MAVLFTLDRLMTHSWFVGSPDSLVVPELCVVITCHNYIWLVVSTHLKNMKVS